MSVTLYSYPNINNFTDPPVIPTYNLPAYYHTVKNMNAKISIAIFGETADTGDIQISFDNAVTWVNISEYTLTQVGGYGYSNTYGFYDFPGITNIMIIPSVQNPVAQYTLQVVEYYYPNTQ